MTMILTLHFDTKVDDVVYTCILINLCGGEKHLSWKVICAQIFPMLL